MVSKLRELFNSNFTEEKYQSFLSLIENENGNPKIPFRIAESPFFGSKELKEKLIIAGDEIISETLKLWKNEKLNVNIDSDSFVPGDEGKPKLMALDFAVCDIDGKIEPRLIEMQAFPSLYAWEFYLNNIYKSFWNLPSNIDGYFCNIRDEEYLKVLKEVIIGDFPTENVILMEIDPKNQGTYIDFILTKKYLNIETVCLSEVKKSGNDLYYIKDNKKIPIHKIYNRVIFDELFKRQEYIKEFDLRDEANVEWVCHPNWFYKISKSTLPHIKSEFIPKAVFLNELKEIPSEPDNFVLKPLYSFSGTGINFHPSKDDIKNLIGSPDHLIQEKINYAPILKGADGDYSKVEIRVLYLWHNDWEKPKPMINLTRMTRGELIGVKFNHNKTWVGGNITLFEK